MQGNRGYALSALIFIGSIMAMMYAVFYMQQLSVALGINSGIYASSRAYNITLSASDASLVGGLQALGLALQLSDLMFVFSIVLFAFATLQLFQTRKGASNAALIGSAVLYVALAYILETGFEFTEPYLYFMIAVIGAALVALPSIYIVAVSSRPAKRKGMARNIGLDPLTPYSNMQRLNSELTSKLRGNLRVLDMHFDSTGLRNLSVMLSGNEGNYRSVSVLCKGERVDAKFVKECRDFGEELSNKGVSFELRIMDQEDSMAQHERIMMDDSHAYKIPPLNIINRKNEHIVKIARAEAVRHFSNLWARATKVENLQQA